VVAAEVAAAVVAAAVVEAGAVVAVLSPQAARTAITSSKRAVTAGSLRLLELGLNKSIPPNLKKPAARNPQLSANRNGK